MFGWILIRHLNIESVFWVVRTAEAYPLAYSFLLGFCETGGGWEGGGSLVALRVQRSTGPAFPLCRDRLKLCPADCFWFQHCKQAQQLLVALSLVKVNFSIDLGGNLDQTYILPLKIDRITCLFSFAVLLSWQEYFLYQRTKSLSFTWLSHWFPLAEWPY